MGEGIRQIKKNGIYSFIEREREEIFFLIKVFNFLNM